MNILHKLRQALIKAGWIRGVDVREPLTDEWESHPLYEEWESRNRKLARIARQRSGLKDDLAKAKRLKLRRRHIYAALAELTEAELRIESGK